MAAKTSHKSSPRRADAPRAAPSARRTLALVAVLVLLCAGVIIINRDALLVRWYRSRPMEQLAAEAAHDSSNTLLIETAAERLLNAKQPEQALRLLDSIPPTTAVDVPLSVLRGRAAWETGDSVRAGKLLSDALQSDPQDFDAAYWTAEILFSRGRRDMAEKLAVDASRVHPERSEIWLLRGRMALQAQDYTRAMEFLDRSVRIMPSEEGSRLRAAVLQALGNLPAAETAAREAVKQHGSAEAYAALGNILLASSRPGNVDEARGCLEKASELDPTNVVILKQLAISCRSLAAPAEEVRVLRRLLRQSPATTEAWLMLGQAYTRQGKPVQAAQAMQNFQRLKPLQDYADKASHEVYVNHGSLAAQLAWGKALIKLGAVDQVRDLASHLAVVAPGDTRVQSFEQEAEKASPPAHIELPVDPEADNASGK